MNKNKSNILKISIIAIILVAIIIPIVISQSNTDNTGGTNNPPYSWATDSNRLSFVESNENITLIIDYDNGTIDEFKELDGFDHYTSVFDFLNKTCSIKYDVYYWSDTSFLINEINGKNGGWTFTINDQYIPVASNLVVPDNNSIVIWKYVGPV